MGEKMALKLNLNQEGNLPAERHSQKSSRMRLCVYLAHILPNWQVRG